MEKKFSAKRKKIGAGWAAAQIEIVLQDYQVYCNKKDCWKSILLVESVLQQVGG